MAASLYLAGRILSRMREHLAVGEFRMRCVSDSPVVTLSYRPDGADWTLRLPINMAMVRDVAAAEEIAERTIAEWVRRHPEIALDTGSEKPIESSEPIPGE